MCQADRAEKRNSNGETSIWVAPMRAVLFMSLSLIGMTFPLHANAQEWTLGWDWQVSMETVQSRDTPFNTAPKYDAQSMNALLDLEVSTSGWLGLFAIKGNDLYSRYSGEKDLEPDADAEFIVRELFWQGGLEISNALLGEQYLDLTLGKMRLDWGVGYGYRPLDIIKPYRQNPVGIVAEEGAGVASISMFDATGEWTLLYSDSSWTSQEGNELESRSEQQGIGLRRYNMMGEHEYQWLAYYDDVRHGLLGASLVSVLNMAWEFHGSVSYQRQSLGYQLPSSTYYPVELQEQGDAYQALLGLTWANEVGHNVVLEYWFDSRAWSSSQWEQALDRATFLSEMTATVNLASSYAQGYQHANLVQHNLMFHWSLESTAWAQIFNGSALGSSSWLDNLTPTFDLMYSPADGGIIATQWLNYQLIDTGTSSIDLELAARFLTGKSDSAYANLPDSHMILLNIKGRF